MTRTYTARDYAGLAALAGLTAVLLSPLRHYAGPMDRVNDAKFAADSFPLSTYPMFSRDRRGRVTVPHVVAVGRDGRSSYPHYSHFGAGGLNQTRRQVAAWCREGRARDVAERYARSLAETSPGHFAEVRVERNRFIFDDWFAGDRTPARIVVLATVPVAAGRAT